MNLDLRIPFGVIAGVPYGNMKAVIDTKLPINDKWFKAGSGDTYTALTRELGTLRNLLLVSLSCDITDMKYDKETRSLQLSFNSYNFSGLKIMFDSPILLNNGIDSNEFVEFGWDAPNETILCAVLYKVCKEMDVALTQFCNEWDIPNRFCAFLRKMFDLDIATPDTDYVGIAIDYNEHRHQLPFGAYFGRAFNIWDSTFKQSIKRKGVFYVNNFNTQTDAHIASWLQITYSKFCREVYGSEDESIRKVFSFFKFTGKGDYDSVETEVLKPVCEQVQRNTTIAQKPESSEEEQKTFIEKLNSTAGLIIVDCENFAIKDIISTLEALKNSAGELKVDVQFICDNRANEMELLKQMITMYKETSTGVTGEFNLLSVYPIKEEKLRSLTDMYIATSVGNFCALHKDEEISILIISSDSDIAGVFQFCDRQGEAKLNKGVAYQIEDSSARFRQWCQQNNVCCFDCGNMGNQEVITTMKSKMFDYLLKTKYRRIIEEEINTVWDV